MQTFKIGDRVWLACYSTTDVRETCPICFGRREVTLILGNGDECRLPCDYCGKGYGGPRGYVVERRAAPHAMEYEIDSVTTTASAVGYGSGCTTLRGDDLFATEDEALARAAEIAAEEQRRSEGRNDFCKAESRKSFAWNAGYHTREAKRCREQAERHERMAKLCKAAAKEIR